MPDPKKSCDLCGLPVEINGFTIITSDGKKMFCCEGCMGIYQMLHVKNVPHDNNEDSK